MEALNQLVETLEKMRNHHIRLLDLAKEKTAVLVNGDIQSLQSLVYSESSCADDIQKLERQRQQLVQESMNLNGFAGHSYTLEELLKTIRNPSLKEKVNQMAKQLRVLIQEISYINESNQQLIQSSLSYVQYAMNLLVPKEQTVGYGPKSTKRYSSLLDAKV